MSDHQFYLTLPSNSSTAYYPENTVANYKTQLSRSVQLPGVWEVAVVEVHFPCSFLTVDNDAAVFVYKSFRSRREADPVAYMFGVRKSLEEKLKITKYTPGAPNEHNGPDQLEINLSPSYSSSDIPPPPAPRPIFDATAPPPASSSPLDIPPPIHTTDDDDDTKTTKPDVIEESTKQEHFTSTIISANLTPGNYTSVEEVIDALNAHEKLAGIVTFEYDSKKVEIQLQESIEQIEMSHRLALMLGFDPREDDLKNNRVSIRPANVLLALPSQMYVYCDIVEPQLIGDTMAPLLQIINIDTINYVYGANKCVQFSTPHYVPIMKSSFESLEIDLRDHTGEHLPFHFGTSCVKLHFRKVSE